MSTILLGVTGSIAAYKACELTRLFVKGAQEKVSEKIKALYGVDISGFAGKVETLAFSSGLPDNGAVGVDDIRFSPEAVPEPSAISFFCLGSGVLFCLRRKYLR